MHPQHRINAGAVEVSWFESGTASGTAVMLLHGYPYDISAYTEVAKRLADQGCRVLVPSLRGFGSTRFSSKDTPRSGEQAALGADLLAFMEALRIERAVLAGYDWGGRAACVVAALWPQRCIGLVSGNGYNIQDIARSMEPDSPQAEMRLWYQYYLHSERGRSGITRHRRAFHKLLWRQWSPTWAFDDSTFERAAAAFDNEDFVDVVVHSYRHRFGLAPGDPAYAAIESRLARQPVISVPTITLDGRDDGVRPPAPEQAHAHCFSARLAHTVLDGVGHNIPQEAPQAFADAVLTLV
jgi:pimeloyl-ACP methyl ester carboxylesterase